MMKAVSVIGLSLLIILPSLATVEARPPEAMVQEGRGGDGNNDRTRQQAGDRHGDWQGDRTRDRYRDGYRDRDRERYRDGYSDRDRERYRDGYHDRDREHYRMDYHRYAVPRYVPPRYDYYRDWRPAAHWSGPPHHRPGYRVRHLPVGYKTVIAAGLTYFVLNEIWYQMHGPEYVVVERPAVEYRVVDAPPMVGDNGFYSIDVHGSRYYIKEGRYYRRNSDGEYLEVPPPN